MSNPFRFEVESFEASGDAFPSGESNWEEEAPAAGVTLNCRPPIVLSNFRTGEYALRPAHYPSLLTLPLPAPVVVIRGHSDNQGNAATNQGISLGRAFEVQHWLTLRNGGSAIASQVIIEGFGATQPIGSNATDAGRSRNRRVEIFLCQAPPPPPIIAGTIRIRPGGRVA